jgi:hypothetical protein
MTSDHTAADAVMVEPIINVTKRKLRPRKTWINIWIYSIVVKDWN